MTRDIRNHIQSCLPCLQNNHHRCKPPGHLQPIQPPEGVWQILSMDFHGPISPTSRKGNRYIISITDILSKFVIASAVHDCSVSTAARFLQNEVILKYGTPRAILNDNGTHFTATMMEELIKRIGATHLYSTPYHPATNGQIERYNATMDAKIASLCNTNRTDWDEQLPFVTFNYNTTIHATTGQIPFNLMHGRPATLPFDPQPSTISITHDPQHQQKLTDHLSNIIKVARQNILEHQQRYRTRYDLHRSNPVYKIDDLVLVKTIGNRQKLDIRYEGPYRIIDYSARKTYLVQHVRQPTLTRQVTVDSLIPLFNPARQ